jgi:ceramide glucosyltransferase
VRGSGLDVNLVDSPFEQPLGFRGFRDIWLRQLRWARLRRKTFPLFYMPEIIARAALPCLAAAYAALTPGFEHGGRDARRRTLLVRSGNALALLNRWHFSWRMPLLFILRDLMLPIVYIDAWCMDHFVWRGNEMTLSAEEPSVEQG